MSDYEKLDYIYKVVGGIEGGKSFDACKDWVLFSVGELNISEKDRRIFMDWFDYKWFTTFSK
jgi:hypothetical protein